MILQDASVISSGIASGPSLEETIAQLARDASIEINVQDVKHLQASRALLPPGKKLYVSFLPKQTWAETEAACCAVREAGFDPIPHIPVRLIADAATLDRTLAACIGRAQVREVLLIAGDYPDAVGSYRCVMDALRSGVLQDRGLKRVSVAGHPEGHPKVAWELLRAAERDKARWACEGGLDLTFVTQFFFEQTPFIDWVKGMRLQGVRARAVGGLAAPASLATLFRFATRCGVGPSIRALGVRPSSLLNLVGDHGPEQVMRGLAQARVSAASDFDGVHFFCFGGFLRTCDWLQRVAQGQFRPGAQGFVA